MADRQLQESIDKRSAAVMELERKYRIAVSALRRIAKPALGGKQQQHDAQMALKDMGEKP
jgi:Mor family transcriptional regulator